MTVSRPVLTLGPILFNWPTEKKIDFYKRIADEAPVDVVYIGEVICSKRTPFFEPAIPELIEKLQRGGKTVVLSTLSLIMASRELKQLRETAASAEVMIEANDVSTMRMLEGKPHIVGPFVNIYNEGALNYALGKGAVRVALPCELPATSIAALAKAAPQAELEVQVFGRLPLAVSSRCYHARSRDLHRDGCQYVCADDPDGMTVETLEGQKFLAVNGTETISYTVCNLIAELAQLREIGVSHFRLWPHDVDMVAVATLFRDVMDGRMPAIDAYKELERLVTFAPFSNGYFSGVEGFRFTHPEMVSDLGA